MDRRELTTAFEQHNGRLLAVAALIVGDWDAAEDVVQEVWLKLLGSAAPERDEALVPWLIAIAKRTALDHLRGERRLNDRALRCEGAEAEVAYPEARWIAGEDLALLVATIAALPARQRQVVTLRGIEGLSVQETAKALGVAEGTVRATLSQARHRLKDARDATPPPPGGHVGCGVGR